MIQKACRGPENLTSVTNLISYYFLHPSEFILVDRNTPTAFDPKIVSFISVASGSQGIIKRPALDPGTQSVPVSATSSPLPLPTLSKQQKLRT